MLSASKSKVYSRALAKNRKSGKEKLCSDSASGCYVYSSGELPASSELFAFFIC